MSDNIVKIPKPSRSAYNPDRPLSKNLLVQAHVSHVHEAEMHLPPEHRSGIDISTIKTEGEAARYIRKVTAILHQHGEKVKTAT